MRENTVLLNVYPLALRHRLMFTAAPFPTANRISCDARYDVSDSRGPIKPFTCYQFQLRE